MPYKLHALGSFKHHGDSAVAAFFWNYRGIVGMENTTLRRVFFFFFFFFEISRCTVRSRLWSVPRCIGCSNRPVLTTQRNGTAQKKRWSGNRGVEANELGSFFRGYFQGRKVDLYTCASLGSSPSLQQVPTTAPPNATNPSGIN